MEPPGIAPGSSPLIARAFISIVRTKPEPRSYRRNPLPNEEGGRWTSAMSAAIGGGQTRVNYLGIGSMGRKLVVAPDRVAERPQGFGYLLSLACSGPRVADEDVGQAQPFCGDHP